MHPFHWSHWLYSLLFCYDKRKSYQDWKLATETLLCFTVLTYFNKLPEIYDTLFISLYSEAQYMHIV